MSGQFKACGCCGRDVPPNNWDHLYGCCGDCAWCQSLGQCFVGEDKPENTVCCHGICQKRPAGDEKREGEG